MPPTALATSPSSWRARLDRRPCTRENCHLFRRRGVMKIRIVVFVLAVFALSPSIASAEWRNDAPRKSAVPAGFFGISPQTELTPRDARYMRAGGIESVRWPLFWESVQPTPDGGYQWGSFDRVVEVAARHRLSVFPSVGGTPSWLGASTELPVNSKEQRHEWSAFLKAAARRYGPGGGFWEAHGTTSANPVPRRALRVWQIWNEANFFYFASPISPRRYGRLVKISHRAISAINPRARIVLAGLFGHPKERRKKGMPASRFLAALYRIRGIRQHFDGIALHPYAAHVGKMKTLARGMRRVAR